MPARFNKRIYTVTSFRAAVRDIFDHLDDLRAAARGGRVSRAFAERIMLAVTQVNGCRYCNWGHTRAALSSGVTTEEIQSIMERDFAALDPHEVTALAFAQHYAESGGSPDPAAWQRLVETYGADGARDIMAYIRMITLGNLLGNTFDALLSRVVGRPAQGSSLWQELGVLLGSVVIMPAEMLRRALAGRSAAPAG